MYSRMDKYHGQKVQRFSIRKYSFGAASVAVAAYMMFGGAATVQAQEPGTSATVTSEQVNSDAGNQADSTKPVASTETSTSTVEAQTAEQLATPAPEAAPAETPKAAEAPAEASKAEEVPAAKADTSKLETAIARMEAALEKAGLTEKTASAIEAAKAELAKAQALLSNDKATQTEVDYSTSSLKNRAFVLESMPKASTDKKENKNQDPRNGQAIPGQGESGFRASTYVVGSDNQPNVPTAANTGKSKLTFEAPTPEKIEAIKEGLKKNIVQPTNLNINNVTAVGGGDASNVIVQGTGGTPRTLELEIVSNQHVGEETNPIGIGSVMRKGRLDYPLSPEDVKKLEAEAPLWKGKLKPDGSKVSTNAGEQYSNTGGYEFLATEIYKLGYEQGVDRVYIPNIKQKIALTEAAKAAGWEVKSITPTNLPPGLIYDEKTDTIQGRVVAPVQNGVYDLRLTVDAENKTTNQTAKVTLADLRVGWIGWQDTKPPKIEVSKDAYETEVGKDVDIDITYNDEAGSNFSGKRRKVNYKLADERTVEIPNQNFRQAVSGLAGNPTTTSNGPGRTSIPGLTYDLSKDGTPVIDENGDQKIYGKGKLSGQPTRAGVYTVGVYAKDYNSRTTGETPWIQSGHEVQEYMTVVVKPKVTVKNVHAYSTNIPVEISEGASTAEVTLPNGKVTKLEAKNGKWVVAEGTTNEKAAVGTELGDLGEEINIPVSQEDTATAATDTITAKATTENVKATLLRNKIELADAAGVKHTATLSKDTGHWELDATYKEVKTPLANGGYTLTKRQVYTEVQTDGSVNYYIYSYTRTYNAQDKVVSVDEVTRDKTVVPRQNTEDQQGATTVVEYDANTKKWKASDGSTVTATKEGDFWKVETTSGFTGLIKGSKAEKTDLGSILNDAPTATSTSYTSVKGATVDLVKQASAAVTIKDTEDDATTDPKKETTVTKVTLTSPSRKVTEYATAEAASAAKLTEVGVYTVKVEVKDSNGNIVTADSDTATGTDKGADTAVASTTYTITIKDQPTDKVYVVEDETVTNDQLKEKVVPTEVDGFTATKNDIADIPTTAKKAGQTLEVPATVTYTKGTETIPVETKVDVVVLPKVEPTGVTVLKDSTGLDEAVKAKAVEAANAVPTDKLPDGVTVRVKEVKAGTVPATTATGVQTPATAVVEYVKDGKVVATREVKVPVTVVGSTAKKLVVFEGDKVTKDDVKGAVTAGTDGTKGEPVIADDITAKAGNKEATVPVTYDGIKDPETVKVPVTVLPVAKDEVTVTKGTTVDKLKEVTKAKAEEVVNSADFKAKLPQGAEIKGVGAITEEVLATITANKGDNQGTVKVPVTYTVDGVDYTKDAEITVNVVAGVPQIVPVSETKEQPNAKNSVDSDDFPEDATYEYKEPVDTTQTGDKEVTVVVKQGDKVLAEVPATVRVVDSTPQFVVADPAKPQPDVKQSITPEEYPEGTTFEYETPVDTTTSGEKDVVVVAKFNGETIVKVPAKVMVVDPKTQYVFENDPSKDVNPEKSIDPEQYPEGTKFSYKEPVDTTTPGDKKVTVVAKDGEDKLVEVPAVVKVLPLVKPEGLTVLKGSDNLEAAVKAKAEEVVAALPKDKVPEGVTVKVKEVKAGTTPTTAEVTETGKPKPATVVVEYTDDKGNVIGTKEVEVPVTVVGSTPKSVVVFEGKTPEKDSVKAAVTPGQGGTVGEPTTLPDTAGKAGATDVTVEVPVTYEGVKDPEKVTVPVTVLPVTKGDVTVAKKTTPEELKKLAKAQAGEAIKAKDFTGKLPKDAEVTVGEVTEDVLAKITAEKGTNTGTVNVPVTYKIPGDDTPYTTTIPVTVNVVEAVPTAIETPVTKTPLTKEYYTKGITLPEGGKVTNVENLPDLTTPGKKDPVKVTVELPNGQTITVDVPVNVTPVKEIETPVTKTPLTKEDYTKGITIPEGGKVTNVENIPDLTTPGKKDPVKVTVELPSGKVVTVEVPVNVTPVKEIETPVTKTPLTPEDYTKGIKIPEGGKVTNVENIPDLTTPGKKDPVKVTVELPNGKVITVEVPVTVTPVKEIETPVTKTPLTPEDYTKGIKIPEGGKITNVENIPDLTTPGKKDPVKVTIELPNGKVITVDVPVTVTPVKEIETPVTTGKLTPEDILKQIKVPEGATTNVENIPELTTPGKKDPVKVTVTLPNGKVVTVDVPVTVTPVKEIETPVTKDKLTPEDILKQIKVPEGATVKVGDLPDLTTPGKKDPVKVTITLPNGKVVTVEVPVNVTPITPIETPVTKDKLTPEDILKQIKVPDGATVQVGDLPDLTTPGKKDPVKVTITLPNGKVVTVEIPVTVTPIEDIVKKQGDPITTEDVEKHIPKGAKVISIGDKPTTDVPGERPSIPVEIELPNGIRVTMNIPVIVTPKVTPVVVSVGTPVTPEDIQKHIELPKGWKVTKVGEIPTTETPGTKPVVPVEIELPDGRKITVDVPVIVTPTVRQIVVPQGTPITPDDVKGHIDLPKEPGWEIVEVGEIPTTIPAGVKPSVKVKIKVPTGEIIEVDVPVIVTPKVTPIVVEVGTPITEDDVKKKVDLPEGWEIVEVGKIPTTETPGAKPVVKVKVKLPDGRIITVEVPVTVTPKSQNGGGAIAQNGDSTQVIVTEYLDENGNRITSDKEGKHNPIELEGYEFSHSTTDAKGNTLHHYKKVTNPIDQEQPVAPVQPEQPTNPNQPAVPAPAETSVATDSATQPATPKYVDGQKELPNTGTEANASLAALGLLGALGGFGLLARKKKED